MSKGEFDIVYSITGRDFGVIYEETNIWHNVVYFEKTLVEAATSFLQFQWFKYGGWIS